MRKSLIIMFTAFTLLLQSFAAEAATEIGSVVAVAGAPSASGPGGNRTLKAGAAVFEDDKITVRSGNAQIKLRDNTRLVVGPGSSLILDRFLMKGGSSAQKVSIKALRGTFRFISGRSKKSAYDIRTSNATIGIRGTGFDFWVKQQTGVAVLQGRVALCSGKRCADLSSNCEVGVASGGKSNEVPRKSVAKLIAQNLPFIRNQNSLGSAFKLPTNKCFGNASHNEEGSFSRNQKPEDRPTQRPDPEQPTSPPTNGNESPTPSPNGNIRG